MDENFGEIASLVISKEEADDRIDKVLAKRFADVQSRQYFQRLISDGLVTVNGRPIKKKDKLVEGDEVEVQFVLAPEISLDPEPIPLDILYEDDDILVINKPVGMVVHPAPGNWHGTFVNALLYHCKGLEGDSSHLRPGIVHRLDKDTSGVLVAAKTNAAHQKLVALFSGRHVDKEYLAICIGSPGKGEVEAAIGRHPTQRKLMTVLETGGRPARSLYETLSFNSELSLVRIQLVTGRTHQARVHMRHAGFPILGDATYGRQAVNAKFGVERQLLHAEVLSFPHPISGESMTFKAKVPEDMQRFIDKITG
ncbi:MAG: RluA family pseudouridine synthase [Chlamydiales bacterium]|nr:RluA family pseudouridine synthase [Chlamydiales bacterium]